jgi:hypothetical protein
LKEKYVFHLLHRLFTDILTLTHCKITFTFLISAHHSVIVSEKTYRISETKVSKILRAILIVSYNKINTLFKFLGFCSSMTKVSILLGYEKPIEK